MKISAVLNAHNEGLFAKASVQSFLAAVSHAGTSGISVEAIVIFDRIDKVTREVITKCMNIEAKFYETDFGDPGLARNFAVNVATGHYVAFLDADDMWGPDWLIRAYSSAILRGARVVWHPYACLYFGRGCHIFKHIDMEESKFNFAGLMLENYWTALSFGSRELYIENPYTETKLSDGFGYEDWTWNQQIISAGAIHKVVPETCHIIRQKLRSVSQRTSNAEAVPRPTRYLFSSLTVPD